MDYLLILLFTIFIASRVDMMHHNITTVLMMPEYRLLVIIYMIVITLFFAYKIYQLFSKIYNKFPYKMMIILSIIIMFIGVLSPYHANHDITSTIHVYFCMISSLSLIIYELIFFHYLHFQNSKLYNKIVPYFIRCIEFLTLIVIVFGSMNSYIEIIYTFTVILPLYLLEKYKFF